MGLEKQIAQNVMGLVRLTAPAIIVGTAIQQPAKNVMEIAK
jgi:hypothetical protein